MTPTGSAVTDDGGTVQFIGTFSTVQLSVAVRYRAVVAGANGVPTNPLPVQVTSTFDEDLGELPGGGASNLISDIFIGPGITADQTEVANTTSQSLPVGGDTDDLNPVFPRLSVDSANAFYPIPITVTGGPTAAGAVNIGIWIDLNRNGVYEGTENIFSTINNIAPGSTNPLTITKRLTAPIVAGPSTVRYRIAYVSANSPTAPFPAGETEDWPITIAAATVITSPAAGSTTNDNTPTITGTAEPNNTIDVREGTTTLCTATAAANGSWSCTSTTLADGSHTIAARATDASGTTTGAAVTFAVDTVAPAPPVITAPAAGSVTADNTPSIAGTVDPALAGRTVTVRDQGGNVLCTAVAVAGGPGAASAPRWPTEPTASRPR
jgi:hypothetical protein